MAMVVIAGNSSGAMPIANARANRADSITPLWFNKFATRINTANTNVIFIKKKPKSFIPFSKAVSIVLNVLNAMLPNRVQSPV